MMIAPNGATAGGDAYSRNRNLPTRAAPFPLFGHLLKHASPAVDNRVIPGDPPRGTLVIDLPMPGHSGGRATGRQPWSDRWLLDAYLNREDGPTVEVGPAPTAWEALEAAGLSTDLILDIATSVSGCDPVDVRRVGPLQAALLPEHLASRFDVVPVRKEGHELVVATANPLGHNIHQDLPFATGARVRVGITDPRSLRKARAHVYGVPKEESEGPRRRLTWVDTAKEATALAPARGAAVDLLERIITDAVDQRASDVHLEPLGGELTVRFRVDGVLHDVTRIPTDVTPLLLSRLKVAAGLDIADRIRPQDGRAATIIDGRELDLRVSTLPLGDRVEKAVIRLLDSSSAALSFEDLGFLPSERDALTRVLRSSEGMVLVTGPTGSGKTTTLYAALQHVLSRETNIVTVEDPIEYRLEGVNQVQVHEKAGLTFAAALRSILRQDPDVVLVGEVRDLETAQIAMRASMTGHLVLTTLHTNDASSSFNRLADIGVDLTSMSGAIKAVIAQRLVRRLCPQCKEPVSTRQVPEELAWVFEGRDTMLLHGPVGCAACRGTGYRGRMAVAEMIVIDDETQQLLSRTTRRLEILRLARRSGMHTLWETGLDRVLTGDTSFSELVANVSPPLPEAGMGQDEVDQLLGQVFAPEGSPVDPPPPLPPGHAGAPRPSRGPSPVDAPAEGSVLPATALAAPATQRSRPTPLARVLVAHEDRGSRSSLRRALEAAGMGVIEAADGDAAVAYAQRLRPDVLVTDLLLPRLDGIGLMQMLHTGGVTIPTFTFSEQDDPELLKWARELGVVATVHASEGPVALAERIQAAVAFDGVALRVS